MTARNPLFTTIIHHHHSPSKATHNSQHLPTAAERRSSSSCRPAQPSASAVRAGLPDIARWHRDISRQQQLGSENLNGCITVSTMGYREN